MGSPHRNPRVRSARKDAAETAVAVATTVYGVSVRDANVMAAAAAREAEMEVEMGYGAFDVNEGDGGWEENDGRDNDAGTVGETSDGGVLKRRNHRREELSIDSQSRH